MFRNLYSIALSTMSRNNKSASYLIHRMLVLSSMLFLYACSENIPFKSTPLDIELRQLIELHGLTGEPVLNKEATDISSPLARLGKRLFHTRTLGGQTDTACGSCHQMHLGGGDRRSLPIGVDAVNPSVFGPARTHSSEGFGYDGGPTVPRNAQSVFNTVFYNKCLFWDCRIESLGATPGLNGEDGQGIRTPDTSFGISDGVSQNLLQAQARFPLTSPEEMRAKFMAESEHAELWQALVDRIRLESELWLNDFQTAFNSSGTAGQLITFDNITLAIASFEASMIFIANDWRKYVHGDDAAISETAKQGALLFYQSKEDGGAACYQCHTGNFFTDEEFHVLSIPQIGRGKGDGVYENHDFGRFRETGNPDDKYAFRTPTLLNVEVTGPYGHSGAYTSLRSIIEHMLHPLKAVETYNYKTPDLDAGIQNHDARENTLEALTQLKRLYTNNKSKITLRVYTEEEVEQLEAFLLTLTDPCTKSVVCLARWSED